MVDEQECMSDILITDSYTIDVSEWFFYILETICLTSDLENPSNPPNRVSSVIFI
jgi:hypothetical protein